MKHIVLWILKLLASAIMRKHHPVVIGITGSVGKTTVRHFISEFLTSQQVDFYSPPGNYNGEYGLPLSILRTSSGNRNPLSWCRVFLIGIARLFQTTYPSLLVLEYGIDHPGEMDFMCDIAEPDILVFTSFSANHIEQFASEKHYYQEKCRMARQTYNPAQAVITNYDDVHQIPISYTHRYGTDPRADMYVRTHMHNPEGLLLEFRFQRKDYKLQTHIFGMHNWATVSPSFLALTSLDYSMEAIIETFAQIELPAGRGNVLKGRNKSIILDGTYNGGYASISGGLAMLHDLGSKLERRTIAIIGDMRELGDKEREGHEQIAHELKSLGLSHVFVVGPISRKYISPIFPEALYTDNARVAGNLVLEYIDSEPEGSCIVFAKGSQNTIFLEEALKKFLDPDQHHNLVRQSPRWMRIKEAFFRTLEN